jgi:hypothetical protein
MAQALGCRRPAGSRPLSGCDDDSPVADKKFHVILKAGFLDEGLGKPDTPRIADPNQASLHG